MTFIQKLKSDTPAKVAQWTMLTSLVVLVMPEAIESLPLSVSSNLREWLKWTSKIIIAIASFYNLTSGKKQIDYNDKGISLSQN